MCQVGKTEQDNRCSFHRLLLSSDERSREYCEAIGSAIAYIDFLRETKLTKKQKGYLDKMESYLRSPFNNE
jgi:hypothetical protein